MASDLKNGKSGTSNYGHKFSCRMGARTVEVRAVGAWAEPEVIRAPGCQEAVLSARIEEAKARRAQIEKEERLRKFQEEVKRRVQVLARVKQEQLLAQSYKTAEQERKIVLQSVALAEKTTPRKDRCVLRSQSQHQIKTRSPPKKAWSVKSPEEIRKLQEQSEQIHKVTSQARRRLTSRRILTENYADEDNIPGGVWAKAHTLDHPGTRIDRGTSAILSNILLNQEEMYDEPDVESSAEVQPLEEDDESIQIKPRSDRIVRIRVPAVKESRNVRVPDIYPGVQSEDSKREAQSQRALYRRLFMDQEREQVKENLRKKEHRKRILQLKKEKEEERYQLEEEARRLVEPFDPYTGQSELEAAVREQEIKERLEASYQEQQQKQRKAREMERYLEALKHRLKEKIDQRGIQLPALCCCGVSIWDTNPDTCANNCVFYKNPKAYGKALQSLLISCDAV